MSLQQPGTIDPSWNFEAEPELIPPITKMSLKTRGIVFATFFGSCLIVGLLVAALTTDNWVQSGARRYNSTESQGRVHFGLFSGQKHLNVAYGWRQHDIDGEFVSHV